MAGASGVIDVISSYKVSKGIISIPKILPAYNVEPVYTTHTDVNTAVFDGSGSGDRGVPVGKMYHQPAKAMIKRSIATMNNMKAVPLLLP